MFTLGRWGALAGVLAVIAATIIVIQLTVANPDTSPGPGQTADSNGGGTQGPLAADFVGITRWINSEPLSLDDLRGRVVMVDFWTYTCINCLRTLPHLRTWHDKYAGRGLVLVGVHSPEFDFEKEETKVRDAIAREGVAWPVAMDNDFETWRAYRNRYWPHKFLIDHSGVVRYDRIGEGGYLETELEIRALLEEAGYRVDDIPVGDIQPPGGQPAEGPRTPITRELYAGLGWSQGGYLGNGTIPVIGQPTEYRDPGYREDGSFYLHGTWSADSERVRHAGASGGFEDYVALKYTAASVNAVVRPEGPDPFVVLVTLDGSPVPPRLLGGDLKRDALGRTYFQVDGPRLYNVITAPDVGTYELRLMVGSNDFSLYTFTFGA